jgi:hypothetical protein
MLQMPLQGPMPPLPSKIGVSSLRVMEQVLGQVQDPVADRAQAQAQARARAQDQEADRVVHSQPIHVHGGKSDFFNRVV